MSEQSSINDLAARLYSMDQKLREYTAELRLNDNSAWARLEISANQIMDEAKHAIWSAYYHLDNLQRLVDEMSKDRQP